MDGGFLVLDFGSQYTQLIARRLRELNVYSEIVLYDTPIEEIRSRKPDGIILSGGPSSVSGAESPTVAVKELMEIAPVLGICYGMQLISYDLGGVVEPSNEREYGFNEVTWVHPIGGVPRTQKVWMSHGDVVKVPPPGFEVAAFSDAKHPAALISARVWAFQFHPEVSHTEEGLELLRAFVFELCGAKPNWTAPSISEHLTAMIKQMVPENEGVLCALSGGVDSTVVGTLLTKALGADRVHCVFVNNGLLRKNEFNEVLDQYNLLGLNVDGVDAESTFLDNLAGVEDPEQKRKIIGHTFIDIFKDEIKKIGDIKWLAQGTLYPDVIESVSLRGQSVTIKSHHNVGGLPKDLDLKLVEPLRELFKDEVRALGEELGIPHSFLWRHPFPGPGLAIRILSEVNKESLETLRECDAIYVNALKESGLYDKIWQAFCVLLPVKAVGVQGDFRTYENVLALRAVTSSDGMTADWFSFPDEFLRRVSNKITNQVRGVNRVVYDVTSKPPGTIEWE
ncbi:MAG: glutamine-hydrolyzing GMP synthase [Pseudobdellovibrionaceae bacterium]|nr:glutamine-hydrolyzing GMP synthase [Bdellovibrionales bacterium]USN48209.1 MAG: glutamine-hydrolyzing GMP synthase [Pseudobdellovibrionaceae bacterium]